MGCTDGLEVCSAHVDSRSFGLSPSFLPVRASEISSEDSSWWILRGWIRVSSEPTKVRTFYVRNSTFYDTVLVHKYNFFPLPINPLLSKTESLEIVGVLVSILI